MAKGLPPGAQATSAQFRDSARRTESLGHLSNSIEANNPSHTAVGIEEIDLERAAGQAAADVLGKAKFLKLKQPLEFATIGCVFGERILRGKCLNGALPNRWGGFALRRIGGPG